MRLRNLSAGAVALCIAGSVLAQSTLDHPVGEIVPYRLDSGALVNRGQESAVIWGDIVHVDNGGWIRLYFDTVELGEGSVLQITSMLDNEVQRLDATGIEMWGNTSAYFNGDTVAIELIAGPDTINRISLREVTTERVQGGHTAGDCGICGPDDRVLSEEDWAGRLVPVGCTASVYTEDSCVVSAGHCMQSNLVMEFRVPLSNPNCSLNHPPVDDQFPVVSYRSVNGGVGNDWAAIELGTNGLGEKPYDRYGQMRPLATNVAQVNDTCEIWGYAIDSQCDRSQAQQYAIGTVSGVQSTYYDINIDLTFGNSGSALIVDGEIAGIVTHCRFGCPNIATRIDHTAFSDARDEVCPDEMKLDPITPGQAGRVNTVTVRNATPDSVVVFAYDFNTGSEPLSGCPGINWGIDNVRIIGSDHADSNGVASVSTFVPRAGRGRTVYVQAGDQFECRISDVISHTFN